MNETVYIAAAKRTAIGNFNGKLSTTPAQNLGSAVISSLIEETGLSTDKVCEVIMGQVLTTNCGQNPARQASINANINICTPATTINQVCGSGLKAVAMAAQAIKSGAANIIIAGGQENMSLAPHAINIRQGIKMGPGEMQDTMIKDGLWEAFNNYHMGITAENIANEFNISREEQDEFAYNSQKKAKLAQNKDLFNDEITPLEIKSRKENIIFDQDEYPKHGTTIEKLNTLRPAFDKQGSVTAGNSSGINDGAAAIVTVSKQELQKNNLTPIAKIASFAQCGVDPRIMGTGPIPASQKALEIAGWSVKDLDLIEANEAFAAQAIAVNKQLNLDQSIVNINGGAIALGHPIGASGCRILVTLLHNLKRNKLKKGLATLCVGGGMGVALCVEAI